MLLKYKNNFFYKSTVFVKPTKRKVYTILRSPYRHKLARHQLTLIRYNINFSLKIKVETVTQCNNLNNLKNILNSLKKLNSWFESNIVYNHKINFSFPFFLKKNFLILNFHNNKKILNKSIPLYNKYKLHIFLNLSESINHKKKLEKNSKNINYTFNYSKILLKSIIYFNFLIYSYIPFSPLYFFGNPSFKLKLDIGVFILIDYNNYENFYKFNI